jgi:hypothetical protein
MDDLFDRLPLRIRKKILRDPKPGGCWEWTGSIREAAMRPHTLPAPKGLGKGHPRGRPRQSDVIICRERAVPKVQSTALGYPVPAHREVYSICKDIPYKDLARLVRCFNDKCVSPHHTHQSHIATPKRGRAIHHGPRAVEMTGDAVMDALRAARPSPFLSPETAALEANCTVPTPEQWAEYIAWDEATPEEDADA